MRWLWNRAPRDDTPGASPSYLPAIPKRGPGVRRLNDVPLLIVGAVLLLLLAGMGYTMYAKSHQAQVAAAKQHEAASSGSPPVLKTAPHGAVVTAAGYPVTVPSGPPHASPQTGDQPATTGTGTVSDHEHRHESQADQARKKLWQTYYQQVETLQQQRHDAAVSALGATMTPGNQSVGASAGGGTNPPPVPMVNSGGSQTVPALTTAAAMGGAGGMGQPQMDGATQKEAFLSQKGDTGGSDTLMATLQPPVSPYEVMQGSFIKARAITGANSGVPGQFTAEVSSDVMDSATGLHVLIPHGSKLVGYYDAEVSPGQTRLPLLITRIIFPDTSSIDIGAMPAADQSGMAGLRDKVNRHMWGKLENAAILAIAGAGAQLTQPQSGYAQGYSAQQIIAGSLGQQFGELGMQTAQSGLAIPNTVKIRPGYTFTIQIKKDIVLPHPYIDMRTASEAMP